MNKKDLNKVLEKLIEMSCESGGKLNLKECAENVLIYHISKTTEKERIILIEIIKSDDKQLEQHYKYI